MENSSETQPKKRRAYRSWMRVPNPVPPQSTLYRKDKEQRLQHNIANSSCTNTLSASNAGTQSTVTHPLPEVQDDVGNDLANNTMNASGCDLSISENEFSLHTDFFSDIDTSVATQEPGPEHGEDNGNASDGEEERNTELHFLKKVNGLDLPVNENINLTKFEIMLLILNFSFRHGLTGVATEDLCKLINFVLGSECIPTSKYWMKKVFGSVSYNIHFYCSKCECYIGVLDSTEKRRGTWECPLQTCRNPCNIQNLNDGYYFVTLPVKEQLKSLLENTDDIMNLLNHRWNRAVNNDTICDIFDGSVYRNLSREGNILSNMHNLSVTVNTDGAVVFHSLKNTLYPIHLHINEFPPNLRFNQSNSLLAGLYFGKKEPNMSLFMAPFVKEMKGLYENGFHWYPSRDQKVHSRVILLQCVLDSVAKPKVQNINQFNGYWGCGYCLHPGVVLDTIASNQSKYVLNDDVCLLTDLSVSYTVTKNVCTGADREPVTYSVEDRTDGMIREDMEKAERIRQSSNRIRDDTHVRGIKGTCVLNVMMLFNLVFGFAIDYMHCVLLGVVRSLTCLWLDSDSLFFIGHDNVATIEKRLKTISPPSSISRRPRPLSERIYWKANEWRSWLLYYSLPCVVGSIPSNQAKHYCLLVSASYILLKDSISRADVTKAAWYLVQFVVTYGKLYGAPQMFYNVHLLLHLGKMAELYGPWWCYSAFSFESANGCLIKLVKGTRGVASQIAEKYSMCKLVPIALSLYTVKNQVLEFSQDLLCYRTAHESRKVGSVTVLGSQRFSQLKQEETEAYVQAGHNPSDYSFERFVKERVMYHARCYSRRGEKSDDSVVKLYSGEYGIIRRITIVETDEDKRIYVLLKMLSIQQNRYVVSSGEAKAEHIKMCLPTLFGALKVINVEEIHRKSIFMECEHDVFVTEFPNMFEKD